MRDKAAGERDCSIDGGGGECDAVVGRVAVLKAMEPRDSLVGKGLLNPHRLGGGHCHARGLWGVTVGSNMKTATAKHENSHSQHENSHSQQRKPPQST